LPERQQQNLDEFPQLKRWKETIKARPAVNRAYELAKKINVKPVAADADAKKILFGQSKDVVR
jgi:GST-like protein